MCLQKHIKFCISLKINPDQSIKSIQLMPAVQEIPIKPGDNLIVSILSPFCF